MKQPVNVQKSAISTRYTLEVSQKLTHILDQEIQRELVQQVQDTFSEKERLSQGWHRVVYRGESTIGEIRQWCRGNCQSEYLVFYDRALFQTDADAVLFQLTWG